MVAAINTGTHADASAMTGIAGNTCAGLHVGAGSEKRVGAGTDISLVVDIGAGADSESRVRAVSLRASNSRWRISDGEVLLYGGSGPGGALRDTWIWKGAGWREVTPGRSERLPGSTAHRTCMAYDKKNKQAVLFGGYTDAPPYLTNATWTWDGRKWTLRTPASSPCPRVFAGMAYDAVSEKIVLVGGEANYVSKQDVWLWDDANWTEQTAANLPDLVLAAMAYDIRRGQMVLFGGYNGNVLSTTTWTQRIACAAGVCVPRLATTGHDAADVNASRLAAAGRDTADVELPAPADCKTRRCGRERLATSDCGTRHCGCELPAPADCGTRRCGRECLAIGGCRGATLRT